MIKSSTSPERKVLAVIPARGGSQGLVDKNIRQMAGKPLICWSHIAATKSEFIDRVILSTDDNAIAEIAKAHSIETPFRRPSELATAEASSVDMLVHAVESCPGYDIVMLLQPTSPLRSSSDIDAAIELMVHANARSCVSVCEVNESPHLMYFQSEDTRISPVIELPQASVRRQDLPKAYRLNGAIYVTHTKDLLRDRQIFGPDTVAYEMPCYTSVDIDDIDDFQLAETRLKQIIG